MMKVLPVSTSRLPLEICRIIEPVVRSYLAQREYSFHDGSRNGEGYLILELLQRPELPYEYRICIRCEGFSFSQGLNPPSWELIWTGELLVVQQERLESILTWIMNKLDASMETGPSDAILSRCLDLVMEFPISKDKSIILAVADIVSILAEGDLSWIHYGHGATTQKVLVDRTLGDCEKALHSYGFLRVHRSYLVNVGCIQFDDLVKQSDDIVLCNGESISVARRRRSEVIEVLQPLRGHQLTAHGKK